MVPLPVGTVDLTWSAAKKPSPGAQPSLAGSAVDGVLDSESFGVARFVDSRHTSRSTCSNNVVAVEITSCMKHSGI